MPGVAVRSVSVCSTPVHFSAISCVICIFRPVVVTGAWTCHLTISQILNKSTKISKNQNKPTQGPSHNYMSENAILLKSGQACSQNCPLPFIEFPLKVLIIVK